MRKIREVLRLYFAAALSIRAIARSLGTSPSTVGDYLRRAEVAGLSWPVPESVDDAELERRLFPPPPPSGTSRPLPDWSGERLEPSPHPSLRKPGRLRASGRRVAFRVAPRPLIGALLLALDRLRTSLLSGSSVQSGRSVVD